MLSQTAELKKESLNSYFHNVSLEASNEVSITNQKKRAKSIAKGKTAKNAVNKFLKTGIISWVILFIAWELASRAMSPEFLPGPIATFKGLKELALAGTLWADIKISMIRVGIGWGRALLIAIPLGLLIGRFKVVKSIVEPLINFFRFIPAIGFLTLFLMWFGVGEESKLVLITYAAVFPIIINTIAGVASIDPVKYQAAQSLGANPIYTFFTVTVPGAIPNILTGVRLGLSSAIISIVAAEMLAASEGLGYLIFTSRLYYRTDWIFAGIIVLGIIGFLADKLIRFLAFKLFKFYGVAKQ